MNNITEKTSAIIRLKDILSGTYELTESEKIILPFIVLKRIDSRLTFSRNNLLKNYGEKYSNSNKMLNEKLIDGNLKELGFDNYSEEDFNTLISNKNNLKDNIKEYVNCFSDNIKDIFEIFDFEQTIDSLSKNGLLIPFIDELSKIDLSVDSISDREMDEIFRGLLNEFPKDAAHGNIAAPQDINDLMVSLLLSGVNAEKLIKIYDPTCGSGNTLINCSKFLSETDENSKFILYGQEINPIGYAISKSRLLVGGNSFDNIKGPCETLTNDLFKNEKFDYIICDPPFLIRFDSLRDSIHNIILKEVREYFNGRFGAGLPNIKDIELLFAQHMISKMKTDEETKIVFHSSGSPLYAGSADSGESNIRRWIFENDYLETLIELPDYMNYYTSISTYIWVLTNKKSIERKGKVQLINAKEMFPESNEGRGLKKYKITKNAINDILKCRDEFKETEKSRILENNDFAYSEITFKRKLKPFYQITRRDLKNLNSIYDFNKLNEEKKTDIGKSLSSITDTQFEDSNKFNKKIKKLLGKYELDEAILKEITKLALKKDQMETEARKIPFKQDIDEYFNNQILDVFPDAELNRDKTKKGYEINLNLLNLNEKYFFEDTDCEIIPLENLISLKPASKTDEKYDFLIKIGYLQKQEKIIYYPHEISGNTKQSEFLYCNVINKKIMKEYLYAYLNSNKGLEHISKFRRTIDYIQQDLSKVPIPVPDIQTQEKIIETSRLIDNLFKELEIWKNNYSNNILDYETTLEAYKDFSCSIKFDEGGGVEDFCRNWRIVYQGLIWPLAYAYLKATKGSKDESTMKRNYLILFEFLAAFNVVVLISAIYDSSISPEELNEIKGKIWKLNNSNEKTWHMMHFGGWTTLYSRLTKIFKNKNYEFITPIDRTFFNKLANKRYNNLFNKLRDKERNPEAHGGIEDDIDVKTKLNDLKVYMETDIFNILQDYSGLKLYYTTDEFKKSSPSTTTYDVMSLNGPCDPPNWHKITTDKNLEPLSLYLHDSKNNSYLKLDSNLIRLCKISDNKHYGIFLFDQVNLKKNVVRYKCYHYKEEYIELTLDTDIDTFSKISESFKKEVLRL